MSFSLAHLPRATPRHAGHCADRRCAHARHGRVRGRPCAPRREVHSLRARRLLCRSACRRRGRERAVRCGRNDQRDRGRLRPVQRSRSACVLERVCRRPQSDEDARPRACGSDPDGSADAAAFDGDRLHPAAATAARTRGGRTRRCTGTCACADRATSTRTPAPAPAPKAAPPPGAK